MKEENTTNILKEEYDDNGFNVYGWNPETQLFKNGTEYGDDGYNYWGYDKDGYDNQGNYNGIKYDKDGYDSGGFNNKGIHRNGTEYDDEGYDINEKDKYGYTREGECYYCCNITCDCNDLF
jgi:hypothetical protein